MKASAQDRKGHTCTRPRLQFSYAQGLDETVGLSDLVRTEKGVHRTVKKRYEASDVSWPSSKKSVRLPADEPVWPLRSVANHLVATSPSAAMSATCAMLGACQLSPDVALATRASPALSNSRTSASCMPLAFLATPCTELRTP
eukprot:6182758-Pleurochrysis_carterae.AAC.2